MRSEIRKRCLSARESLSGHEVTDLSARLAENLLRAFPRPPGVRIGFCWPVRNEPDVRPAIHAWLEMGAMAALPVVVARGEPLIFRRWQPGDVLLLDHYGIPTPLDDAPEVVPDALLIPLNAFDAAGFRLGYGGGFFDRTLAALTTQSSRPLAIGVGFELGRVQSVLPEAHDQPMDWLVTEREALRVTS